VALLESKAPADPLTLFGRWYREAQAAGAPQPEAVALGTAGKAGPSVRMVLFKGIKDGSFVFYSNYDSRKGHDLAEDDRAAIVFYWPATRHQVRVSGTVRRLDHKASLAYFRSRQRGAQLSA
jgi:pyridoxine/pyridoxamine 5'-phosphate oxidase